MNCSRYDNDDWRYPCGNCAACNLREAQEHRWKSNNQLDRIEEKLDAILGKLNDPR